jgi:hypothetical protein
MVTAPSPEDIDILQRQHLYHRRLRSFQLASPSGKYRAGAGGCHDLSHILGLVKSSSNLSKAFQVYDSIRRPRAQKLVHTSAECGVVYVLGDPECGDDRQKVVENLNKRWLWIWEHDLEADVKKAQQEFAKLSSVRCDSAAA